jgi:Xaa-Pro aminopeptidase
MRLVPAPEDADLIQEKQRQAIAALDALDLDAWFVFVREGSDTYTVQTIAGPEHVVQNAMFVLTRDGTRIALLEPIDVQNGSGTHYDEIVRYQYDIAPALKDLWKRLSPKRVALNFSRQHFAADGLSHGMYLRLVDALGAPFEAAAVPAEELISRVRSVKSDAELDRLRKACAITVQIAHDITAQIRPGVTDTELGEFVARRASELGASEGEASIAVNRVGQNVKGPVGKTVEAGQVVLFDMGVRYKGYHSDLKRTYFVQDAQNRMPDILGRQWEACRASVAKSLELLKPGNWAYDVHEGAWAELEAHGFKRDKHAYGHQIGRQVHDAGVWLGNKDNPYRPADGKLLENMVFTLDPTINRVGISDPAWWSMGMEDIGRVTPTGGELLHEPQEHITVVDW